MVQRSRHVAGGRAVSALTRSRGLWQPDLWPVCLWGVLALTGTLAAGRPCPKEVQGKSAGVKSPNAANVRFVNEAGVDINMFWVDLTGAEREPVLMAPRESAQQNTFQGHLFHFRSAKTNVFLFGYRVPKTPPTEPVSVPACDGTAQEAQQVDKLDEGRWLEFERLVHDQAAPCMGPSSNWSCVRFVSPDELGQRESLAYGFHKGETGTSAYKVGQTEDHLFANQQGFIMNVTNYEGGYLKMEMTDGIKKALYPWYEQRLKDAVIRHGVIPGGFSNNHIVEFDKIELTKYPAVMQVIVNEMKQVLEWWTKMRLKHSTTFGIRIYRRDSMLVNHLDRQETHIASAVLQVGQDADEGWPLEVIHPHRKGLKEVYLQPGQMVLYEGARITHGRPMRFKGEMFANLFTHFAPHSWHGLNRARPNPYYKQKPHGTEL
mmetsp:Transcript_115916/g.322770  ORF Transcript_115916/g.322770 Transcript_115916/m.322770 type:complete len:432 (+) Transcript_115916:57-1352(+)